MGLELLVLRGSEAPAGKGQEVHLASVTEVQQETETGVEVEVESQTFLQDEIETRAEGKKFKSEKTRAHHQDQRNKIQEEKPKTITARETLIIVKIKSHK